MKRDPKLLVIPKQPSSAEEHAKFHLASQPSTEHRPQVSRSPLCLFPTKACMRIHTDTMEMMFRTFIRPSRRVTRLPCLQCRGDTGLSPSPTHSRRSVASSARQLGEHIQRQIPASKPAAASMERMRAVYKQRNRTTMYARPRLVVVPPRRIQTQTL